MQRLAALPRPLRAGATLALALAAALVAVWLGMPLPWIIGPLLATAACGVAGLPLAEVRPLRNAGPWMIGVARGLNFTPQVLALLLRLAPALLAGIVWALLMGWAFYRWLWWLHRHDGTLHRATAFFAAAIGGASEMAVLAERHGGQVDRVAAAHSLRVLVVVVIIPFGYQAAGIHGADAALPGVQAVQPAGLALLLAASLLGVGLVRGLRWPNPWVLGALAVTAALTAGGIELSALPAWMSQTAQLFIGVALGSRFTPDFARAAPRWLAGVAAGTLAMIAASGAFAWVLATLAGLHPATVMLGTSPGGIAEMCITAKVLQLGVPVVTALHVTRYVAVLVLTPLLYRRAAAD
jgi:membrane AbrB-like protein